jgi:hypothetical protein
MKPVKTSILRKACLFIPLVLAGFCLLGVLLSALSNLGLPQSSTTLDRLDELEKARLSEVIQLRRTFGEEVWPGWEQAEIPLIVYNEQYAFLVGYTGSPTPGWLKFPSLEPRGGPWEEVPGDTFEGQPYYRSRIEDPEKTPEAFTVLVGDRFAASFMTREYSEVAFYRDFRQELPSLLSPVIPVRLVWALLMGKTEMYIAALEHESFHAYQGSLAVERLAEAERYAPFEERYPFETMDEPWREEMDVLVQAALAETNSEASELARNFLNLRAARRESMSPELIEFERLREWEEGLAKYAELEISRAAALEEDYHPVEGIQQDPDFKDYNGLDRFWSNQLREAKNTQGRSGDSRFYYSGNALAVLLDRLSPDWKPRALPGSETLDELLEEALN